MAAAGVTAGEDGRPKKSSDLSPCIVSFVMAILLAGMMRHIFIMAGMDAIGKSLFTGLGIGLFVAAPWIVNNVIFSGNSTQSALIDGGYCTVAGLVLGLFNPKQKSRPKPTKKRRGPHPSDPFYHPTCSLAPHVFTIIRVRPS